jgi:AcrR family transcriptional regulator
MGHVVMDKARRPYRSPTREASALKTRARVSAAAAELFLSQGYAATSIRAIAHRARVAEKTVYLQFENKGELLKRVVEQAIVGDDEPIPVAERDWFQHVLDETDPPAKLRQLAAGSAALHARTGRYFAMARGAAEVDPQAAALWAMGKRGHASDMTRLAQNLDDHGLLPAGTDVAWATSVLYVLLGPETWQLITGELSNTNDSYQAWLERSLLTTFRS